jgi:hypothetical protein
MTVRSVCSSRLRSVSVVALSSALQWSPAQAQAASACEGWDAPAAAPKTASCGDTLKDGVYTLTPRARNEEDGACLLTVNGNVDIMPGADGKHQRLSVNVNDGGRVRVQGFDSARRISVGIGPGSSPTAVCVQGNRVKYTGKGGDGALFVKLDEGREGAAVEVLDNLIIGPAKSKNGYSIAVKAKREDTLSQTEVTEQKFAATSVIIRHNAVVNSHTGNSETIALNGPLRGIEVAHNLIHKYTNIGIDLMGGEPSYRGQPRGGDIHHNLVARYMEGENDTLGYALYSDGGADLTFRENLLYATAAGVEVSFEYECRKRKGPLVVSGNDVLRNVVDQPVGACKKEKPAKLNADGTPAPPRCPAGDKIAPIGIRFGLHDTKEATYLGCNTASENHVYGLSDDAAYSIELELSDGPLPAPGSLPSMSGNFVYSGPGTSRALAKPDPRSDANCTARSKQQPTSAWHDFATDKPVRNQLACALLVTGIDDAGGKSTVGPRGFGSDPDLVGARASLIAHYGCGQPAPAVAPSP